MSRFRDAGFIFELGFVFAIYFAFIFVYLLFSRAFTVFVVYLAIAILVSVTVFLFYRAYQRRQVFAFFIGFTVIGILLFSLSTAITVPYTETESYVYTSSESLCNNTVTLGPYESQNISLGSPDFPMSLLANGTVIQLRFSNTRDLRVRLYYRWNGNSEFDLGLDQKINTFGDDEVGVYWRSIYWTPKGPVSEVPYYSTIRRDDSYLLKVTLENSEDTDAEVIFKANYYDFTATSTRDVTRYRSAIDPYFGYFGAGLIVAAVIIEFWAWQRARPIVKKEG